MSDIVAEIRHLNEDINACCERVSSAYKTMNNGREVVVSTCDCHETPQPVRKHDGLDKIPTSYHRNCVPQKNTQAKSQRKVQTKPTKKCNINQKEQFVMDKAVVDVQVKSCGKSSYPNVEYSKQGDDLSEVKCYHVTEVNRGDRFEAPSKESDRGRVRSSTGTPLKKKSSWGNILKEQNHPTNTLDEQQFRTSQNFTYKSDSRDNQLLHRLNPDSISRIQDFLKNEPKENVVSQDKSVQCSKSSSSSSKSQKMSYSNSAFSSYNPVRTLQFLMGEFRSKVKQTANEGEINDIVQEMETTLQRISVDSAVNFIPSNSSLNSRTPMKSVSTSLPFKEQINVEKYSEPKSARSSGLKNEDYGGTKCGESSEGKTQLQKKLEESCRKLEETCRQMEYTCSRLREERDTLVKEISDREHKLEDALTKLVGCEARLEEYSKLFSGLTVKNEDHTKTIKKLNEMVQKLKEENKAIEPMRNLQKEISGKLHDALKENEDLNMQLQLLELGKEKHNILLKLRDQEMAKLRKDIQSLGGLVGCRLEKQLSLSTLTDLDSSGGRSSPGPVSRRRNATPDDGLIASSPNTSTSSSSPLPYRSWQRVSTISVADGRGGGSEGSRAGSREPAENIKLLKSQLRDLFSEMRGRLPAEQRPGRDTVWSDVTSLATTSLLAGAAFTSLTSDTSQDTSQF